MTMGKTYTHEQFIAEKRQEAIADLEAMGIKASDELVDYYYRDKMKGCNLDRETLDFIGDCEKIHASTSAFTPAHSSAYHSIGTGIMSMSFNDKEPMTPKERKKHYRTGVNKMLNKGRKY